MWSITANVLIGKDESDGGFKLAVRLDVKLLGIERSVAEDLAEKAHDFCPYSKATRGNIEVELEHCTRLQFERVQYQKIFSSCAAA
jgi:osmotically inducible protein OsmC